MIGYLKQKKGELVVPLLMFGYATHYYLEVRGLPRPEINLLLIQPVYIIMAIAVAGYFVKTYTKFSRDKKSQEKCSDTQVITDKKSTIAFVVLTCAYAFSIEWLGFVTSSFLYMILLLFAFSVKSKLLILVLPALTSLFIYITFDLWLNIPLPKGWLL